MGGAIWECQLVPSAAGMAQWRCRSSHVVVRNAPRRLVWLVHGREATWGWVEGAKMGLTRLGNPSKWKLAATDVVLALNPDGHLSPRGSEPSPKPHISHLTPHHISKYALSAIPRDHLGVT